MSWGGWGHFWAMGGYAPFVWGAYGVTLAALVVEVWLLRRRRSRALARVERLRQRAIWHGDETQA
jgi:heme exporter protein D